MARPHTLKPPKYPAKLSTPFTPALPAQLGIMSIDRYRAAKLADERTIEKRFFILAEYYDALSPSGEISWEKLARALAMAHVPGLHAAYTRKRGRPSKRSEHLALYLEVLKVLYSTRIRSISNACKRVAKGSNRGGEATVIEARFHEIKRWLIEGVPADRQVYDRRFGYPLACPVGSEMLPEFLAFYDDYINGPGVLS